MPAPQERTMIIIHKNGCKLQAGREPGKVGRGHTYQETFFQGKREGVRRYFESLKEQGFILALSGGRVAGFTSFREKHRPLLTRTWSGNLQHIRILESLGFKLLKTIKNHRGKGIDTLYFGRVPFSPPGLPLWPRLSSPGYLSQPLPPLQEPSSLPGLFPCHPLLWLLRGPSSFRGVR